MDNISNELPNGTKWCHLYQDKDGITTIHDTENNETYRIIPSLSGHGIMIEYHKDGKLKARNGLAFTELKILALLAGSNNSLKGLSGGESLNKENTPFVCPDCAADLEWDNKTNSVKFIQHNS